MAMAAIGRLIVGRVAGAGLLVAVLLAWTAPQVVRALEPWIEVGLALLGPQFQVVSLQIDQQDAQQRLAAQFTLAQPLTVGPHTLSPDPRGRARSAVPVHHVLLAPAVLIVVLLGWPSRDWPEAGARAVAAVPMLALLVMLDVPASLVAGPWRLLLEAHEPQGWRWVTLVAELLERGLRPVLGLLCGVAIVAAAAAKSRSGN